MRTLAIISVLVCFFIQPAQAQQNVSVSVTTATGAPIADVPLASWTRGAVASWGRTDNAGALSLQVQVGEGATDVLLKAVPWYSESDSVERQLDLLDAWRSKVNAFRFERLYRQILPAGGGGCQVSIVVKPAITVTGTVVSEASVPVPGWAVHAGMVDPRQLETGGNGFRVGGVPKNEASYIYVGRGQMVKRQLVPAAVQDLDLGEISIAATTNVTPLRITIPKFAPTPLTEQEFGAAGITLIAANGSHALSYRAKPVQDTLTVVENVNGVALPVIPEGEYYLLPGNFTAERLQVKLWDALIDGATIPIAVPRIVASGSTEIVVSLNPVPVLDAIESMP